jgi:hypothetical protein
VSRDLHIEHWAVCFLDLLGQRDALRKMDFLPDQDDEAKVQELLKAVRGSVGVIREFFRLYDVFSDRSAEPSQAGPLAHLPTDLQQVAKEWRSTERRSSRFSDGLMVYSSLVRSPGHSPVNALYDLIGAWASLRSPRMNRRALARHCRLSG